MPLKRRGRCCLMSENKGNKRFKRFSESDFGEASLPHNRFEVFCDLCKTRWRTFLWIGLILFLFALPLITVEVAEILSFSAIKSSLASNSLSEEEYLSLSFSLRLLFSFLRFLSLLLFCFPLAGLAKVYRIMVYYEMFSFKDDFLSGIKENLRNVFFIVLLCSLLYSLTRHLLLSPFGGGFLASLLCYAPMFLFALFLLPPFLLCYCSLPFYLNSFRKALANSFPIYFSKAFHALGFSLLLFLPLLFIPLCPFLPLLFLLCLYFLFYLPLALLSFFLFSVYCFDRCINKTSFPEIVDKGICRLPEEKRK